MSRSPMLAPAQKDNASLAADSRSARLSADQFYEEEIDLFSQAGTGVAEGSSVSSCDFCFIDSDGERE